MNDLHLNWQITNDQIDSGDYPLISVVVPIFNEQSTVRELLNQLFEEITVKEIILVDDGSTDGTAREIELWLQEVCKLNSQTHRIVCLRHARNLGKGMAIRSGLSVARGRFALTQDADLEVYPAEYNKLLQPLVSNQAEFVIGSRRHTLATRLGMHRCGVAALNALVWLLYGYRLSDSACCFKVLKSCDLARMDLQCERFEFCPEVIAKAARMGLAMAEVDVTYTPRSLLQGKKLQLLRDGFRAITTLFRYWRWTPSKIGEAAVGEQPQCVAWQPMSASKERDA